MENGFQYLRTSKHLKEKPNFKLCHTPEILLSLLSSLHMLRLLCLFRPLPPTLALDSSEPLCHVTDLDGFSSIIFSLFHL